MRPDRIPASAGVADPVGLLRARSDRIRHVEHLPAREGVAGPWPEWVHPDLRDRLSVTGITHPWSHQAQVAELTRGGHHVALATGTASGKSVAMWLPAITAALEGGSVLYLSPTKALAADQVRALHDLAVPGLRFAAYDGDTPNEERQWARRHADYLLTNPDMLHYSLLPGHASWSSFLKRLQVIVIDECHAYRGVFGAHVSAVVRRLRRVAAMHGANPVVIAASATVSDPATSAGRLIGDTAVAVTQDGSPRPARVFALWQPPLIDPVGVPDIEGGELTRRGVVPEAADLLADLVSQGTRTLVFARSRRGAEAVAMLAREALEEVDPGLAEQVAAYRGGYLPEERHALESGLRDGSLVGVAATTALELGIDVSGLDAVVIAGWPGTRASLWQQAGRAGRAGRDALAVLIARDDPLDTYLVSHPEAIFSAPVEASVFDPGNPAVLRGHLCAAAAEIPLTTADAERWFGAGSRVIIDELTAEGLLRARPSGWFWTRTDRASDQADLRGTGGQPVQVVEEGTGRLLGTVDAAAAHATVHEGAVYVHQGVSHLVSAYDIEGAVALVEERDLPYTTTAKDVSDIRILSVDRTEAWGDAELCLGSVEVSAEVVGYIRRRTTTGEVLAHVPLDLPVRTLVTRAVWWTVSQEQVDAAALSWTDLPGAAHAAEHASIGLLPLIATCDRWDIGGVSTALHADTGRCTVFVHDGHPGGAGFAERGFEAAGRWLEATREAISACACRSGCPACVQSPKCGNGNEPLDKAGAIRLLDVLLAGREDPSVT